MDITEEAVHEFQALMQDPAARQAFVEMKAQQAQQGAGRRYEHVLRVVGSRAWALEESMLALIVDVLAFRAYGGRLTADELDGRLAGARRTVTTSAPQGVARIPISGVIVPKASAFGDISGGTSVESMRDQLNQAVASPQVGSIILDVDSPGGMVDGIPELAADIRDARKQKPVIAVANTEAMSAAYWLASQADRFFASPSARVGSIGVLSTHEDRSVKAEHDGIKTTIIHAGKFKAEGSPFAPLSEGAKAHLQALVDSMYAMFLKDVSLGRGVKASAVEDNFGQGRFFDAQGALDRGMIDGIATIDEVIAGEFENIRKGVKTTAVNPTPAQMAALDLALQPRATPTVNVTLDRQHFDDDVAYVAAELSGTSTTNAGEEPEVDPIPDPERHEIEVDISKEDEFKTIEPAAARFDESNLAAGTALDPSIGTSQPDPSEATPPAPDPETAYDEDDLELVALEQQAGISAVVDESAWDGNKAMGQCSSAADYRTICAGERSVGEPDQRQHWALPHHYLGKGPNADGVRAALGRVSQTDNLSNEAAAQAHLDAHMREINPGESARGLGHSRQEREMAILEDEIKLLSL
jgi:signal peptide peptidase SppA